MVKPTLIRDNSAPKNILEALQNAVIKRYTKPYGGNEPIVYEFTQDRGLLHQYYHLREVMYRKMFETDKFKGEEDTHDKLSYILVARRGRLCLGGCRLTVREGDEMWPLPMESENFKVRELFPMLSLLNERHGEISRFAIMEDCGNENEIFYGLCKLMYEKVIELRVHYLFAKSTYTLARNWRLIANKFGVRTTKICNELKVPENPIHPGVEWFVTLSDLSGVYEKESAARPPKTPVDVSQFEDSKPQLALVD